MVRQLVAAILLLFGATQASVGADGGGARAFGEAFASRSAVYGANGVVATSQPLASLTAIEILKQGGSAVDAAIAANALLSLVEPHMCGPGGDLFAVVWDPDTSKLIGLNGSGRSPSGLSYEELIAEVEGSREIPSVGPLSVTVPGAVDAWFALHERYGKLPMSTLLAPAIRYAMEGVVVPQISSALWSLGDEELHSATAVQRLLGNYDRTFRIDGAPPEPGTVFRNPELAATFDALARQGRDAFYEGEIAEDIVDYLQSVGGFLELRDFSRHASTWVEPVSVDYRGYQVFQLPPNSQGLAVLQMLNILEGFDVRALGAGSSAFWHTYIETKKLVYEDRAKHYSDPESGDVPVSRLLSEGYADQRRRQIGPTAAAVSDVAAGAFAIEEGNTTYIAVGDSDGMMVSLIQSNYGLMGSGLVPDGLGFPLQNRGSQFSLERTHGNRYEPGKRPFHTIIPGFVLKNGKPFMSLGVVGGDMQPQGQVLLLVNIIDFGMGLQAAGDAARIRHAGSSSPTGAASRSVGELYVETGVSPSVLEELKKKGHVIGMYSPEASDYVGGFQAIQYDPEQAVYKGASEMRLDGAALAY